MADEEQLWVLLEGFDAWNTWRTQNSELKVDLSGAHLPGADLLSANLSGANLRGANLRDANLSWANLAGANLTRADLSQANLAEANLAEANLMGANLTGANLGKANLAEANLAGAIFVGATLIEAKLIRANLAGAFLHLANLFRADFTRANLARAHLSGAILVSAVFTGANLTGCIVYGVAAWNVNLEGTEQKNLIITTTDEPQITVDNLEVAQFIYLLLHNEKIRHVIDTITSKVVLILGRFTPERKVVLNALKDELRQRDYTPVLFDFDKPASKDLTGTVQTLANMARFVIADLTDPSSVPHELAMVVPTTPVAVQPVLLEGQREYAMFADLRRRHHWVLEPYRSERLIADLSEQVIVPAEAKARELRGVSPPTG